MKLKGDELNRSLIINITGFEPKLTLYCNAVL